MVTEKLLSEIGMNVTTINTSIEGLNLAIDNHYDFIMVDHMMPDMSGPELLEEIRAKAVLNKATPVIVLTGNVHDGIENEYAEMGFAGYICKPVIKEDLFNMLVRISRM